MSARPPHRAAFHQGTALGRLQPLAPGQHPGDRLAEALAAEVELARKPGLALAHRLIAAPFFAPAACGWARITVPSRKCSDQPNAPRASAASRAASTRSQPPASCHRRNREYTVCQLPYRSGRSRQSGCARGSYSGPSGAAGSACRSGASPRAATVRAPSIRRPSVRVAVPSPEGSTTMQTDPKPVS